MNCIRQHESFQKDAKTIHLPNSLAFISGLYIEWRAFCLVLFHFLFSI